jgi:hypothetical protein
VQRLRGASQARLRTFAVSPVRYMTWVVKKNLRPGTIVILHDGISDPRRSIQALPQILDEGHRRELTFVWIGELMRENRAGGRHIEAQLKTIGELPVRTWSQP